MGTAALTARKRRMKLKWSTGSHTVHWVVTAGSALLSFIVVGGSLLVFYRAPDDIEHQHLWGSLKDIGPAIAGSWVLCAALLAITAAGITELVGLYDSESHSKARRRAIERVCVGEIKAFWDLCNRLELQKKLQDHLNWLRDGEADGKNAFRRDLGDDWFIFFRVDLEALGELSDDVSARYISLSTRCRNVTSRLNWLNSCSWDPKRFKFWINYHADTLELLNDLYEPSGSILNKLGSDVDPRHFKFL